MKLFQKVYFSVLLYYMVLLITVFLFACEKEKTNFNISVEFNSPLLNEPFSKVDSLIISVNLKNSSNLNSEVSFYLDDYLINTITKSPYIIKTDCSTLKTGNHKLKVVVSNPKIEVSKEVTIKIVEFQKESDEIVDFYISNTDSWYMDGWEIQENNQIMSQNSRNYLLTSRTFTEAGNVNFYLNNSYDSLFFYIDGKLISSLFPNSERTKYFFAVSPGKHSFKWKQLGGDLSIENIYFESGFVKHSAGEYSAGGVVVYTDSSNMHGLVAFTKDIGKAKWGCVNTYISEYNELDRTDGMFNTIWIVENCESNTAAQLCNDLTVTQNETIYDDWYLPTGTELYHVYLLKDYIGGYSNDFYWTSYYFGTEISGVINFEDGRSHRSYRNIDRNVIAMRKF